MASKTAIVLSGGGSRGAYEAGVLRGIVEVLGLRAADRAPFGIFVGTSVGAINTAYLASHAHRGDMAVAGLCRLWSALDLRTHLVVNLRGITHMLRSAAGNSPRGLGGSVLDARPFEKLIREHIDWAGLHDNVRRGDVSALVVAALRVADGQTTMFAELADGVSFVPSADPFSKRGP